jgi:acylphosphatase
MKGAIRTARLRIAGRVQGVGYRLWAIDTAASLGLRGWVRNRADGTVELLATGTEDAVAALICAARQGPPGARVTRVDAVDNEDDGSLGFTARPTA